VEIRLLRSMHGREDQPLLMVVEDDAGVAAALRQCVPAMGFRLVLEPCVQDACETLRDLAFLELAPVGLLADFDLPDGTGCQVLQSFRHYFPGRPVALMSGSADLVATAWMREQNVALVPKPFTLETLRRWLANLRGPLYLHEGLVTRKQCLG